MKPRILAVDDEPQILRFLRPSLEVAGYQVITAASGTEALRLAATVAPDAVLLDLGLPDIDGKEVIARLRSWSKVPILVLSARDREGEKIAALDVGANDYIEKPFGIGELMARLRAALRHVEGNALADVKLQAGPLMVDTAAHSVTCDRKPVKLTPKEFDLIVLLIRNAGRVLTHRQILTSVWGTAHTEDVQYLRVLVGQLRQKLDQYDLIQTEPGIGYRLKAD